jgi:hypothetical protein
MCRERPHSPTTSDRDSTASILNHAAFTIVVVEHSAQPLASLNSFCGFTGRLDGNDQTVAESLVVTFQMIVRDKLRDGFSSGKFHQRRSSSKN